MHIVEGDLAEGLAAKVIVDSRRSAEETARSANPEPKRIGATPICCRLVGPVGIEPTTEGL
jgi:hypothetical protein